MLTKGQSTRESLKSNLRAFRDVISSIEENEKYETKVRQSKNFYKENMLGIFLEL